MSTLDKTQMNGAFAFFSVMLLVAALYSAPILRAESASASMQSFIGMAPAAADADDDAPTF